MILFDYSPHIISNSFYCNYEEEKTNATFEPKLFKTRLVYVLKAVNSIYRGEYGSMVIAPDRKPYWRTDIFPAYKKHRPPLNPDIPWETVFSLAEEVLEGCKNVMPWKVVDIPKMEADDIIAVLTQEYHKVEKILVVSPDGDFKQLQQYPNVSQVDVIRNMKKIRDKYPLKTLKRKLIYGDKKDTIANIKSDPEDILNKINQRPIQRGELDRWMDQEPERFCTEEMLKRYRMNEKLLDFRLIPEQYRDAIVMEYMNAPDKKGNIYGWLAKQRLSEFIDQIGDFT